MKDLLDKAGTLMEALPWIKEAWGRKVVIKYGGAAMKDPVLREQIAADIVLMKLVGVNPIVVHGGGSEITGLMERLGMPVRFLNGQRVTTEEAMDIVRMVLVGKVNKELVGAINMHGRLAIGVSGEDGNLVVATPRSPEFGRVGDVVSIDTTILENLIDSGFIPVVASVATGDDGASLNVNADLVAGEVASALGADKVIFLTDVNGLYREVDDPASLLSVLTPEQIETMMAADEIAGGMLPKVTACLGAIRSGVRRAHILNGTVEHALLLEVYTDEGVGTMITGDFIRGRVGGK